MVVLELVIVGMVHSRYGPLWEWLVLEKVTLGMVVIGWVVLGLIQVPSGVCFFCMRHSADA